MESLLIPNLCFVSIVLQILIIREPPAKLSRVIVIFDVGYNLTVVTNVGCRHPTILLFEKFVERLDRLTTSANIVSATYAQLVKEHQNSIILFSGWFR